MNEGYTYRLHQDYPDPLSRQALQRMRRPAEEAETLTFAHYTSPHFERIRFELTRYCNGEINGFSVLIAGQRGAGKTTLTKLVIQKVMQEGKGLIPLPLLLHGPTIIDPTAVTAEAADAVGASGPQEKERALRYIITALYRSLSTAIYDAWLIAAEEAPEARRAQTELLGLRAHLDLRLERAPDPDVLRKIWARAGFLHCGVAFYLRPSEVNSGKRTRDTKIPPVAGGKNDQGLREVVALSACADAYRVILGETKEHLRTQQEAEQARETQMTAALAAEKKKAKDDSKEKTTVEKLAPPTLGTAAGGIAALVGTHANSSPKFVAIGIMVGILVWIASWSAMSFGVRRSKQQVSRELTIDVKWDIDRLERDLPALLKRVKDAGFAPIFVLDELDKTKDTNAALERFLSLTKHIVTDHAAFLFLTDRDYYEKLIAADAVDWGVV
jgi:hypothetical protein